MEVFKQRVGGIIDPGMVVWVSEPCRPCRTGVPAVFAWASRQRPPQSGGWTNSEGATPFRGRRDTCPTLSLRAGHQRVSIITHFLSCAACLFLSFVLLAPEATAQTNTEPLALWDVSTRLTLGGGYRDNVALSSVAPENSPFVEASADFSVMRLSNEGALLSLFILGEFRRYTDSEEINNEDIVYSVLQFEQPVGTRNTLGAEVQYFYENQVLDVTEIASTPERILVLGHGLSFKPKWQYSLGSDWDITLEGTAYRQIYEVELDGYWEGAGRLELKRSYGNRSFVSVDYEYRQRFYNSRDQYDSAGQPIPDTELTYQYQEVGGEWRHYWDAQRHWRTTLKAGYLMNRDNGSGYFDYDRVQASLQFRWRPGRWDAKLQGRAGWYSYPRQPIAGERRERSYYSLELRVERMLDRNWLVYASGYREEYFSNEPLDQYSDWMASAGIGVEF